MIRFYAPDIEADGVLPEAESAHCCRVLRMRAGDVVDVTDGKGFAYRCEITDPHPRHTSVMILERVPEALHWSPRITLAVAPTKNMDRMEWLLEKAVEIGVNRIVFLDCEHSVRRVVKRERVEKILVSAMKQSLKATLPELEEMVSFRDYVARETAALRYVGYCDDSLEAPRVRARIRRRLRRGYNDRAGGRLHPRRDRGGDRTRVQSRDIRKHASPHRDRRALRSLLGPQRHDSARRVRPMPRREETTKTKGH